MRALLWMICVMLLFAACTKRLSDEIPTCNDGIQNQNETAVDCGGDCTNACPTCSDGVRNQGEASIDCGGPCSACTTIDCTTCISQQGTSTTYCEDDFESQAAYEAAIYNAIANGWTCN